MKTTVLSIKPIEKTNEYEVLMLIGNEHQQFNFKIEHPQQESFAVIGGDINFCKFFRFNQHISAQIGDLVRKFDKGKVIKFPVSVGTFYTPEEAMELQKHVRKQVREEKRSRVRNQAIELVEKLPESMLDEAIKALESLYVKANPLK
ncbi:MAG: hypothetical protein WA919_23840 [Coleofasciculaceae cyanobacterium]